MKATHELIEQLRIERLTDPLRAAILELELTHRIGLVEGDDPRIDGLLEAAYQRGSGGLLARKIRATAPTTTASTTSNRTTFIAIRPTDLWFAKPTMIVTKNPAMNAPTNPARIERRRRS